MKTSIQERILIQGILPSESTFEKLILWEDIRKKLEFTKEEIEKYQIQTIENEWKTYFQWNEEWASQEFDIDFTESEKNHIFTILKEMSLSWKLKREHIWIYKKFNS